MDKLKHLKEMLMDGIYSETSRGLQSVNKEELGEAIDMVKDIEEIIYYCSITEAMEENKKEKEYSQKGYSSMNYPPMSYNNWNSGRMYYNGGSNGNSMSGGNNSRGGGSRGYSDGWMVQPLDYRDHREGRSYVSRRNYMESKELHHGKEKQMQELDRYVQELTDDVLEMIYDATPEEKMALSQKMTTLANKIQ